MRLAEPYLTEPPLLLSYLPGRSSRLVISFSGVGLDNIAVPKIECAELAGEGGENHVLFVVDASRSWLNFRGMMARLKTAVAQLRDAIQPSRVVAIGNSMGGSAALIFAAEAQVDAVLAIAPQYSVHPDLMPRETRWIEFTAKVSDWVYPTVPDLSGRAVDVVILHGTMPREMMHARRFGRGANVDHYLFRSLGHSMAGRLKRSDRLAPITAPLIAGNLPATRSAIVAAGGIPYADFKRLQAAAQPDKVLQ